jgi:hypothetical protein
MKALWLMILLATPMTPTAQLKASQPQASDLIIVAHKLGPIVRVDVSRSDPPPDSSEGRSSATDINPPHYEWRAKAKLEIQNTGTRSIRSFYWGVLLVINTASAKEIRSYQICFKKTIRPGKRVTVRGWIRNESLKGVSKHTGIVQEKGQITNIEYEDGSMWKGPPLRWP